MKKRKTYKMDIKSLGFVILFIATLLISQILDQFWHVDPTKYPSMLSMKSILINILSTVACACGVSAVWEIFCKQSFTEEVLTLSKMSESCFENGIEYVYSDYNDIDWVNELKYVKKFTIFFCYGYTWRNHNRALLRNFISSGGEMIVYLPDYTSNEIIDELDRRFGFGNYCPTKEKISTRDRIIEASTDFERIGATVKYYRRTLCSLYFVMDDKAIMVPYRHCEKMITYPAIRLINRGCMYNFIKEDLDNMVFYDKPHIDEQPISETNS